MRKGVIMRPGPRAAWTTGLLLSHKHLLSLPHLVSSVLVSRQPYRVERNREKNDAVSSPFFALVRYRRITRRRVDPPFRFLSLPRRRESSRFATFSFPDFSNLAMLKRGGEEEKRRLTPEFFNIGTNCLSLAGTSRSIFLLSFLVKRREFDR